MNDGVVPGTYHAFFVAKFTRADNAHRDIDFGHGGLAQVRCGAGPRYAPAVVGRRRDHFDDSAFTRETDSSRGAWCLHGGCVPLSFHRPVHLVRGKLLRPELQGAELARRFKFERLFASVCSHRNKCPLRSKAVATMLAWLHSSVASENCSPHVQQQIWVGGWPQQLHGRQLLKSKGIGVTNADSIDRIHRNSQPFLP